MVATFAAGPSVLTILLVSFLAGCVGGGPQAGPAASTSMATAAIDADKGTLRGTAVNDEHVPVAGAEVAILEAGASVRTAADGAFAFHDLALGPHSLVAQALGYESHAQKVTVVAGEAVDVTLVLKPLAVIDERQESFQYTGFLNWAVVTPAARLASWFTTGGDKNSFKTNVTQGVETVVDALVWESSAPATAKRLQLTISLDEKSGGDTNASRSPLYVRADEPKVKKLVGHTVITPFTGTQPDEAVTVAYQQKFDIWTSVFYGRAAPQGFRPDQA